MTENSNFHEEIISEMSVLTFKLLFIISSLCLTKSSNLRDFFQEMPYSKINTFKVSDKFEEISFIECALRCRRRTQSQCPLFGYNAGRRFCKLLEHTLVKWETLSTEKWKVYERVCT